MKRFDLMHDINVRGTYICSKSCLPYLKKSSNPHILNLSPPINLKPKWFENFTAYTMSKYSMSMITLGMSSEYKKYNIAVNSLWTKTAINTSAISMLGGFITPEQCRKPEIVGVYRKSFWCPWWAFSCRSWAYSCRFISRSSYYLCKLVI